MSKKRVGPGKAKRRRDGAGAVTDIGADHSGTRQRRATRVMHMVVFARYTTEAGKQIINDIGHYDAAAAQYFHIVLVGYSDERPNRAGGRRRLGKVYEVPVSDDENWYFDDAEYVAQRDIVQKAVDWIPSGGTEVLLFDVETSTPEEPATIDEIFGDRAAGDFGEVIVASIDELKANGLIRDFEEFFNKVLAFAKGKGGSALSRPTFALSDALAASSTKVGLEILANALELKWGKAFESAVKVMTFRVRNIKRAP